MFQQAFTGFCLWIFFRAQPEKDAFLPPKSDGTKTPQFTDVSLSRGHNMLLFWLSSHVLGMHVGREVGGGGAGDQLLPP